MLQARVDRYVTWRRIEHRRRVAVLAAATALCWLIFVGSASSSDEGGYLLAGSHWHAGTSLYGNYWVDRPPGLIAVFALADSLGGVVALRILGALAAAAAVVLAGVLGRLVSHRSNAWLPACAAAAILSTPLFEAGRVNGEVICAPLVLAGIIATLMATWAATLVGCARWSLAAGVLAIVAVSVKQNFIDVFVVLATVAALRLLTAIRERTAWRQAAVMLGSAAAGALGAGAAILAFAAAHGTSPAGLWDAVVMFRLHASHVDNGTDIGPSRARLFVFAVAIVGSLLPVLIGSLVPVLRRPPVRTRFLDLRWPAVVLLAWEGAGVVAGGNLAPHYLLGLVPGVTLAVAAATQRWQGWVWFDKDRRRVVRALVASLVASYVAVGAAAAAESLWSQDRAAEYLRAHARHSDTAVTAFGSPSVIQQAGLSSPYPYLWTLEARVRDPHLATFNALLAGPGRPTWVIEAGDAPAGSGELAGNARTQRELATHYVRRTTVPGWTVLGVSFSTWTIYQRR